MSKPKFNPNASFEPVQTAKPKFNPGASFDPVSAVDDKPGMINSGIRKFTNSAIGGFNDEIAGAAEAVGRAAGLQGVGGPALDIGFPEGGWDPTLDADTLEKAYRTGKQNELNVLKRDSEVNPLVSGGLDLTGAVFSPLNKVGKGLSLAKQAAVAGGITGLGNTEADNVADFVQDVGGSMAMSGAGAKVLGSAAPLFAKAVTKSKQSAKEFAAKALGLERGSASKIIRKDDVTRISELGEYALENKLLSPLASVDDIKLRNTEFKEGLLETRNQFLKNIDDAGASKYNSAETATEFEKAFPKPPDYLSNKSTQEAYDKVKTDMMSGGNKFSSIQKADELRKIFGDAGKFEARTASPAAKVYQRAYGALAEAIDKAGVDSAAAAGISPVSVGQLNKKISLGIGAENLLNNAIAKQGNKSVGITDSIFAAPMFASGNIAAAAATIGAKKAFERYGNQNSALLLNKLGNINPKAYNQFLNKSPMLIDKIMPYSLITAEKEKDK